MIRLQCHTVAAVLATLFCTSLPCTAKHLALSTSRASTIEGIEFDAHNQPGSVVVTAAAVLHPGQRLVLSPTKNYDGTPLIRPRTLRIVFETNRNASLRVETGARLVIEGEPGLPISCVAEPEDPAVKPVVVFAQGGRTELRHVSFFNIALRLEGSGHVMSDVSVQYAGDQPAFTFAGTRGNFDHLFAHHSTWGFSFEPLAGLSSDLTIRDSTIRSCAKGTGMRDPNPSTYVAGGSLRSIPAKKGRHRIRFIRVDWDPVWDELKRTEIRASGQRPRIVTIGDSIGQGCCRYVNFWNYLPGNDDIEHSWPYQLQLRVPDFFVINKAEGGNLTTEMMARLPAIIQKIRPKYCYIGGGTNDVFRTSWPPEQTVENYRSMWLQLKRAGIVPIQLAITPQTVHPELEARIKKTNALLRVASERDGVRFEDVYTLLESPSGSGLDPAYDPGDGLHPNKKGYKKLADSLFVPALDSAKSGGNASESAGRGPSAQR
jgi:lysophospholipase L1-like esterase